MIPLPRHAEHVSRFLFHRQVVTILDARIYEFLSLAMRYFFTLMGAVIVWRSFSWLRKDRRQKHRRLRQLPDAGTIGILTVLQGGRHLREGEMIPAPHEGVLGYLRTCDVVVPVDDVATMHLDFTFADGKGLYIYPRRGCEAIVDGVLLSTRRDGQRRPMQHGSVLEVGQAVLRLGVFAGLDVQEAAPAVYLPQDELAEPYPVAEEPEDWSPEPAMPPQTPYPHVPYPMHPPVQPPYAPPLNQSPWQGGDDDAQ